MQSTDGDVATGARLAVHSDRRYWLARGLAAAAFALACASVLRPGVGLVGGVLGGVGLVMFGGLAVYAARQGLRRAPRLVLSPRGVEAADLAVGTIPWRDIEHVERFGSAEAPFIAFRVREPGPWIARLPARARLVERLLRAQGLPPFSIHLIGVDREPADIARRAGALLAGNRGDDGDTA